MLAEGLPYADKGGSKRSDLYRASIDRVYCIQFIQIYQKRIVALLQGTMGLKLGTVGCRITRILVFCNAFSQLLDWPICRHAAKTR